MGNGFGQKPLFAGLESPAIAHNEVIASARFVTFDVPEGDFPGNRSRRVGNLCVDQKRKIYARSEGARFQQRSSRFLSKAAAL
jgi:hypothetical protein